MAAGAAYFTGTGADGAAASAPCGTGYGRTSGRNGCVSAAWTNTGGIGNEHMQTVRKGRGRCYEKTFRMLRLRQEKSGHGVA